MTSSSSLSSTPAAGGNISSSSLSASESSQEVDAITYLFLEKNGNFSALDKVDQEQLQKIGPTITDLNLSFTRISEENVQRFSTLFPHLKHLSLSGATVETIPFMKELIALDVSSTDVFTLSDYRELKEINVSYCAHFSASSVRTLLLLNDRLEKVSIANSKITELQDPLPNLIELDCSACLKLEPNGLAILSKSPKLRSLKVSHTFIETLPQKLPVQKLDLTNCTELRRDFVRSLKGYPNLTDLALEYGYMGLLEQPTLERLEITGKSYTPNAMAFACLKERCPKLTAITLHFDSISESDKEALQKELSGFSVAFS